MFPRKPAVVRHDVRSASKPRAYSKLCRATPNEVELSEEIDLSIDVDAEFQSVVNGYVAQKDTFAKIRAQSRPACCMERS